MSAFPVAIEIGYRQCHLALAGQVRDYGFESAVADAEQNTHASGLTLTRNYGEIRLTVPVEISRHNGIRIFGIGIDHRCSERSITVIHQYRLVVRDDSEFVRFARPRARL
jgi:hypothetical protein